MNGVQSCIYSGRRKKLCVLCDFRVDKSLIFLGSAFDADKLDAVDVIGLARCLQEAGYNGQSIEEAIAHLQRDTKEFIYRCDAYYFKETKEVMKYSVKMGEDVLKELRRKELEK